MEGYNQSIGTVKTVTLPLTEYNQLTEQLTDYEKNIKEIIKDSIDKNILMELIHSNYQIRVNDDNDIEIINTKIPRKLMNNIFREVGINSSIGYFNINVYYETKEDLINQIDVDIYNIRNKISKSLNQKLKQIITSEVNKISKNKIIIWSILSSILSIILTLLIK